MKKEDIFKAFDAAAKNLSEGKFGDRTFPDAAFVIENGAEKDEKGKTLQKYRHLPHHNKGVKSATENGSVDLPHLRNALARVNQVKPVKESVSSFRSRASSHLRRHAKTLLKTYKEKASAATQRLEKIRLLCEEFKVEIEE